MLASIDSSLLPALTGRCLITGANGFIGSQLLSRLQKGRIPVRALLRKPASSQLSLDAVICELGANNIPYQSLFSGIDTVFHLANTAHTSAVPDRYEADCDATLLLARHAEEAGVQRFVFVSSTKAAAEPGLLKRDEKWDKWPEDNYGYWKRMAEQRLLDEVKIPHIAIVRPCLVYGVGVKGNLDKLIRAVNRGYFPPLPDTSAERSMVSVCDVVNAMLIASTHPDANRQPLIVADCEVYTAYSVYLAIRLALGKGDPRWSLSPGLLKSIGAIGDVVQHLWTGCPVSSEAISRLIEPCAYSADKMKALGWQPTTTFYKELPAMISACLESER